MTLSKSVNIAMSVNIFMLNHNILQVDPSGPLATLRKLLLSEESIASLKNFLMTYWYTVIFIVIGIIVLMVRYLSNIN